MACSSKFSYSSSSFLSLSSSYSSLILSCSSCFFLSAILLSRAFKLASLCSFFRFFSCSFLKRSFSLKALSACSWASFIFSFTWSTASNSSSSSYSSTGISILEVLLKLLFLSYSKEGAFEEPFPILELTYIFIFWGISSSTPPSSFSGTCFVN